VGILFAVPWLDKSSVKSGKYRPLFKLFYAVLLVSCLALGWAGGQQPEGVPLLISRLATLYYFVYFLVVLPLLPRIERTLVVPDSIYEAAFPGEKSPSKKG
jgi:quinol-cytochrome oxidoreductase complex cytochrome b subunit